MNQIQKNMYSDILGSDKVDDIKEIKAKATIMLLQAQEYLQLKQYEKAKEMFVLMGECLSNIKESDTQTLQLLQLSCSYLANSYKSSIGAPNGGFTKRQVEKKETSENLLVLKYNKFSGQFQLDQYEETKVNQDILQYVSKINAVLFGYQNVQNNHSLYVILKTYWVSFILTLIFLALTILFISSQKIFFSSNKGMEVLAMISGGLIMVPLIMIYAKEPEQRNTLFFQQKLGEYIDRINEDCRKRNKPLAFLMPHGGEINIKLEDQQKQMVSVNGRDPEEEIMNQIKGLTKGISKKSDPNPVQLS